MIDARRALEEIMYRASWREPGCVLVETPTLMQVVTPSVPFPYANGVYRFVDDDLDEVFARFGALPFRFIVSSLTRPTDLAERLEARGLKRTSELAAMWAPTTDSFAAPADVAIEPLRAETIDEYCNVSIAGWGMSEAQGETIRRTVHHYFHIDSYRGYLARIDGAVVGTGLLRFFDDVGYLQGSSVLPAFRGRGVYRALVAHRMKVLRDQGAEIGLIHARTTTAAPICTRLGFRTEYESAVYDRLTPAAR